MAQILHTTQYFRSGDMLFTPNEVGNSRARWIKEVLKKRRAKELGRDYLKPPGLAYNDKGELWVGSLGGVTIRNGGRKIDEILPKDGITNVWVNVVERSPDGTMWVGTNYGITRFTPGKKEYSVRLSKRWLVSNEVRDIAFDKKGNAWIATANGVSAIKKREMTLAQKADFFYQKLIQRHVREPWIVNRFRLTTPGDTTTLVQDDDDNDGEPMAYWVPD